MFNLIAFTMFQNLLCFSQEIDGCKELKFE